MVVLEMLNKNVTKTVIKELMHLNKFVYDLLKFDKKQLYFPEKFCLPQHVILWQG